MSPLLFAVVDAVLRERHDFAEQVSVGLAQRRRSGEHIPSRQRNKAWGMRIAAHAAIGWWRSTLC